MTISRRLLLLVIAFVLVRMGLGLVGLDRPLVFATAAPALRTTAPAPAPVLRTGAQRRCSAEVLRTGTTVAPWRLGAIHMLSGRDGVAVTAARVDCARRIRGGEEVSSVAQTALLAVTRDGGARWTTTGHALPPGPLAPTQGFSTEQIAAASLRRVWVLGTAEQLVATANSGASWRAVAAAPGPVGLALTKRSLWVLSCRLASSAPVTCPPRLERIDRATGRSDHVSLPPAGRTFAPALFAVDERTVLIDEAVGGAAHPLLLTRNAGGSWMRRALPRWQGRPCPVPAHVAVLNRSDWWFLCLGGAAAGSSEKALFRTTDAGGRWTLQSAVDSLTAPEPPGTITGAEPAALAAGSAQRLWLATLDGLEVSDTAGRSWRHVPGVNQGGNPSAIDALGTHRAWLLSPGTGLWRTTDGVHWIRLGPSGPH